MAVVNEFFLTYEQKKAVLDLVKTRMKRDYEDPERDAKGLCTYIKEIIAAVYNVSLLTHEIKDVFPNFTYDNAKMVSNGDIYECKEPKEYFGWWPRTPYDYQSRIRFISWLKANL